MRGNVINKKNVKIPLYVAAHRITSQWLREGEYKAGDKLSGENILAEQLAANRGTLQQAMPLLQEDGLIISHQGRGNIVPSNQDVSRSGLEKTESPIVDFCNKPVDKAVTVIGFQPATQEHQQVLKLQPPGVVAVIDITCYCGGTLVSFTMVYIPREALDNNDVDPENPDTVHQYYTGLSSRGGLYSDAKIWLGQVRERLANVLNMRKEDSILILEEVLYSEYDMPILSQKLLFGSEQHELNI